MTALNVILFVAPNAVTSVGEGEGSKFEFSQKLFLPTYLELEEFFFNEIFSCKWALLGTAITCFTNDVVAQPVVFNCF